MPAYCRALDLMALATKELSKGNLVNASTLLHRATKDESLEKALRMVEATNAYAQQVEAKAVQAAAKKVIANEGGFEPTDDDTMALLNQQSPVGLEDETDDDAAAPAELAEEDVDLNEVVQSSAKAFASALAAALKGETAK